MARWSVGPGSTVLITGASSGLGRCLALGLASMGCALFLAGRSRHRLQEVKDEVLARGAQWVGLAEADLSAHGGPEALLAQIEAQGRPIDALINNAGEGWSGLWSHGSDKIDHRLERLLIDTPLALTRHFLSQWRKKGRGAVLNVASSGAFQPGPRTAVYYASKAFLTSWSVALAREEREWLNVLTLCPGAMRTPFAARAGRRDSVAAIKPEVVARIALRSWKRNRGLVVPGLLNQTLIVVTRLLGPEMSARLVETLQRPLRTEN